MRNILLQAIAAVAILAATGPSAHAQDIRTEQVVFAPGTSGTAIRDTITGYESVSYVVGAEAGQRLDVRLDASNLQTYFNVYPPGSGPGDEALANSGMMGPNVPDLNRVDMELPYSGEYTVSVYMMRAAARRNERSDYTLDISITGETGAIVRGDYADGLQGGPDFFEVRTTGGKLNLRAGPSGGAALVTQLDNGTNLRNLGCRMSEGRRWCRVATLADPGLEGWVAGDFLVEGRGTAAAPASPRPPSGEVATGTVRVRFPAGASGTDLAGNLAPGDSVRYVLGAGNGQFLYVTVAPRGPGVFYQIFNPDGSFLLDQMSADQPYRGQLWQSGDHVVEVINRGSAPASYNVTFGIE